MSQPRQTCRSLYLTVAALAVAVVAFQPRDPIAESGARASHPVIDVPAGNTLLPHASPGASVT